MTVKDLIQELSKYPENMLVLSYNDLYYEYMTPKIIKLVCEEYRYNNDKAYKLKDSWTPKDKEIEFLTFE